MTVEFTRLTRRGLLLGGWAAWAKEKEYSIGGIRFTEQKNGRSKRRYLHIHGNETTAREVLREHMAGHNGVAFFVVSEKRNVEVSGGCLVDPNRMFSRVGAERSMRRLNRDAADSKLNACLGALDRERERFVKRVLPPKGGVLIAMHNNSEGYSVNDELAISDRTALQDKENPRDFMLATDEKDFEAIAQGPYNVVLQRTVRHDDGSFSVLAAGRGVRYVNIEAALGKREKQKAMIQFLESALR
jgi:dipeptidyl aminopeptidase/acylaminoacyl peptidase